jgi:hypothetical protein
MHPWSAVERRAARRAARRKTGTARCMLYLTRQRTSAAVAPASAGDGRRPMQREQAPQRRSQEPMQGVRGREHLPAPAPKEPLQGLRGCGHLPAPARKEQMQGVRGGEHLPAPAHQQPMQRVRGREHLPAPVPKEQMQGVPRGGGHVDAGWPGGARGNSACCW